MVIFQHLGETFPHRALEWVLAGVLTSWGLMLLRPEETFAISIVYDGLKVIASERVWGWACLVVGALRFVALFVNGAWVPPSYFLRTATSFASCFFWFTISFGLMVTGTATTGLAVYPWLLIGECICIYRTARDARMAVVARRAERGDLDATSLR